MGFIRLRSSPGSAGRFDYKRMDTGCSHEHRNDKRSCLVCGVRPNDSLDLGRAARVVLSFGGRHIARWHDVLAISDPSTMVKFLDRAGLVRHAPLPDIRAFLRSQ